MREKSGGFPVRRSIPREDESRTDEAINGAARDLTRGEPSPRLRHAVRSRIQGDNRAKPVWIPALASAFVLAIVGTIVVWQSGRPVSVPPAPQVAAIAPPAVVVPTMPNDSNRSNPSNLSNRSNVSNRRPLPPIAPLVIEPIAVPVMAVTTSSGVVPIEIDGLQIEPLQIQ